MNKLVCFSRRSLMVGNSILWLAPGVNVLLTGIKAWYGGNFNPALTLCLAIGIFTAFHFMFTKIVMRNIFFLVSNPKPRVPFWEMMPLRTWLALFFFMGLGITLKTTGIAPPFFTAFFYCGLGPALIEAGIRYLMKGIRLS